MRTGRYPKANVNILFIGYYQEFSIRFPISLRPIDWIVDALFEHH